MVRFLLGVTSDFFDANGDLAWGDIGLGALDKHPEIELKTIPGSHDRLSGEHVSGLDAVLLNGAAIDSSTFACDSPPKLIARFGAGYDKVDVEACTREGVLLTNTPDGTRRPVALAALTGLLASAHKLIEKDKLVRQSRWQERLSFRGRRISGSTLGVIGLGNIGKEFVALAKPLNMTVLAYDPYISEPVKDVELTSLANLLMRSDYVVVLVPLNETTHGLIGEKEIELMKESATLINMARGHVIVEDALIRALIENTIAGAVLDVFEEEPLSMTSQLITMENVILTPHALCWTDELSIGNGTSALTSIIDVANKKIPKNLVNPEALAHPRLGSLERMED